MSEAEKNLDKMKQAIYEKNIENEAKKVEVGQKLVQSALKRLSNNAVDEDLREAWD